MNPRLAPQHIASDPAISVWVSANAGTGKTKVLTDRVLRILLTGTLPSRILCITYTNAAAAEMENRIHTELSEWAIEEEAMLTEKLHNLTGEKPTGQTVQRARRLFALVLEAPDGLRIQTIHAFCQSLLRRFPLEAGTQPHFTVIDDRTARALIDESRLRLFSDQKEDARLGQAIARLVSKLSEFSFAELIDEVLKRRRHIVSLLKQPSGPIRIATLIYERLGLAYGETAEALSTEFFYYDDAHLERLKHAVHCLQKGSDSDIKCANILSRWVENPGHAALIEEYCLAFLTADAEPRKRLATKKATDAWPELLSLLEEEQLRALAFDRKRKTVSTAQSSEDIACITESILSLYGQLKLAQGYLDYDDLILTARDLLRKPTVAPWVLYKLDGGLDHLLVDEAQDTSPEQWELISILVAEFFSGQGVREDTGRPRTLFVVGDEKQSIFSFQGADPHVFDKMRAEFSRRILAAGQQFKQVRLALSYRSTGPVLQAVDAVFANPQASKGLTFSENIVSHDLYREGEAGRVELWPLIQPQEEEETSPWQPLSARHGARSPSVELAGRIADTIGGWLKNAEPLASKGRPTRAGDILILMRHRGPFIDQLVRACKRRNIPVAGVDRLVLTESLAVQDMLALGNFLLLPEDDLNLACLLKSPLIGLEEEQLYQLAYNRERKTLWQRLWENHAQHEFEHAHSLLESLLAKADMISPYQLFAEMLEVQGGRKRMVERMGEEVGDPLDEFLSQALQFEGMQTASLQNFLHWFTSDRTEIKRDHDGERDEVRIMTVHGAKGLQAPIVFMPDTVAVPREQDRLFWSPGEEGEILLWPSSAKQRDPVSKALAEYRKERRAEEYRRLLYVAMTRAADQLYICGWQNKRAEKPPEESWYSLCEQGLRGLLQPTQRSFGRESDTVGVLEVAQTKAVTPQAAHAQMLQSTPLPAFALTAAPIEPRLPNPLTPAALQDETQAAASPVAEQGTLRRAKLTGRLLRALASQLSENRPQVAENFLQKHAVELSIEERAELYHATMVLLDHPVFAPAFSDNATTDAFVSGIVTHQGHLQPIAGTIDRLAVTENAVYMLMLDAMRCAPQNPAALPPSFFAPLSACHELLKALYPEKAIHCAYVWLERPFLYTPLDSGGG